MYARTDVQIGGHVPEITRAVLKRLMQILGSLAAWAIVFFAAAGKVDVSRAWIYLALCLCSVAINAILVIRKNPDVVVARSKLQAGAESFDEVFVALCTILLFIVPLVAGLDAVRFGWSAMAFDMVYPGVILFLLAWIPITAAMITNPHLECLVRIQRDRDHHVIASGPYGFVRHPMYVGCILQNIATPLILGSWWTYVPVAMIVGLFVWRAAMEDRTLRKELPGYEEFARHTHYKLLPGVW